MPVLHESKPVETTFVTITKEEYESMKATIEVLSNEDLMRQIKESKKAVKEGRVKKWSDLMKEMGIKK